MKKRNVKFEWSWLPKKQNWSMCLGVSYNYWNPRGKNYCGTYIFSVHIFTVSLRWFIAEMPVLPKG